MVKIYKLMLQKILARKKLKSIVFKTIFVKYLKIVIGYFIQNFMRRTKMMDGQQTLDL
jgi:hypothetical protein